MSERDLIAGVIQLSNLLTRRLAPIFEKANVTPQQWSVMTAMDEAEGPLTLAGLARVMKVSKQNMTGMIARLQQLGLADRSEDPVDLRASRVQLTRRGRSLMERLRPAYEAWRDALGPAISERDRQVMLRAIESLITQLDGEPDE